MSAAEERDSAGRTARSRARTLETCASFLVEECHQASATAGWWGAWDSQTEAFPAEVSEVRQRTRTGLLLVCQKLALIHSEVSEALEGARKGKQDDHLPHRPGVEVELADAVIRICDLAGAMGLDLGGAVAEKMAYNAQRADHKLTARSAPGGKAF
jgi:NTP pyrophosphatase (non-canonical NTP hydrolase)